MADVFEMSDGARAITLRATFTNLEKTLSGEFLETAQRTLLETVERAGYPLKTE